MTAPTVERIARLVLREGDLREAARIVELNPARRQEAAGMFRRASALRAERLRLARECFGLV